MNILLNPYLSSAPLPSDEEEVYNCYIHIPELENKGWIVISRIGFTLNHYKNTTLAIVYYWERQETKDSSSDWDWSYNSMICFDKILTSDEVMQEVVTQNDLDLVPMRHDYFCQKYNFSKEDETILALQLGEARRPKDLSSQFQPPNLSSNINLTTKPTGESHNAI